MHIDCTNASQMKREKSCLVRRVRGSLHDVSIEGLVRETDLTREEVERHECGMESMVSRVLVRYMSKAALTWYCELLDGLSWGVTTEFIAKSYVLYAQFLPHQLQVALQPKRTLLQRLPRHWWCFRKLETV